MVGDDLRGLTPAIMKAAPAAAMIGMQGVKAVIELEQPGSKIESEGSHWWAAQLYWQPPPALSIISNHVPRDPAVPGYSWLDYSTLRDIEVDRHLAVYKRVVHCVGTACCQSRAKLSPWFPAESPLD